MVPAQRRMRRDGSAALIACCRKSAPAAAIAESRRHCRPHACARRAPAAVRSAKEATEIEELGERRQDDGQRERQRPCAPTVLFARWRHVRIAKTEAAGQHRAMLAQKIQCSIAPTSSAGLMASQTAPSPAAIGVRHARGRPAAGRRARETRWSPRLPESPNGRRWRRRQGLSAIRAGNGS